MIARVVTRYPLSIRVGVSIVCALLALGLMRGPVHGTTILVVFAVACLAIAVFAYRAEVNEKEVRVRYAPFYTKRTPVSEIVHFTDEKTLVLVTATSRIPLWGLSDTAREVLFGILPRHLDAAPPRRGGPSDALTSIRKHRRWSVVAGIGFVVTAISAVPFFKGNALHDHWNTAGQYVLLVCLLFFIAMIFEAGFTWVLWSTKREIDRIDSGHAHKRH